MAQLDVAGPVAALVEQPAERVLHRARRGGEDVRLDRGQVDDVLPDEPLRDHKPVGVDVIQHEELLRQVAHRVLNRNPLFAFVQVNVTQAVRLDGQELLVLALAQVRVDHDCAVVARVDEVTAVAVGLQRANDALKLPRRGRAAGEEEVPRDIDLQRSIRVLRDHVLVAGQVQEAMVVGEDGARCGAQDCDFALCQVCAPWISKNSVIQKGCSVE